MLDIDNADYFWPFLGILASSMAYIIVIALYTSCFQALLKGKGVPLSSTRRRRILFSYISLLLVLSTVSLIQQLYGIVIGLFFINSPDVVVLTGAWFEEFPAFLVLTIWAADGFMHFNRVPNYGFLRTPPNFVDIAWCWSISFPSTCDYLRRVLGVGHGSVYSQIMIICIESCALMIFFMAAYIIVFNTGTGAEFVPLFPLPHICNQGGPDENSSHPANARHQIQRWHQFHDHPPPPSVKLALTETYAGGGSRTNGSSPGNENRHSPPIFAGTWSSRFEFKAGNATAGVDDDPFLERRHVSHRNIINEWPFFCTRTGIFWFGKCCNQWSTCFPPPPSENELEDDATGEEVEFELAGNMNDVPACAASPSDGDPVGTLGGGALGEGPEDVVRAGWPIEGKTIVEIDAENDAGPTPLGQNVVVCSETGVLPTGRIKDNV
ncbi:hypothetical protein GALMADRAFT_216530 [Galerina marginata CBS 339.88]|uniref:Uncharacterized protein n=1 Tax=Galerina marginata (strain CBS 339.88) TaxID=685588 RepID=A0A067S8M7_GALM3|nr:hypothetical protein GALMADRAFT_216530 [Galerina marginata CBS 339.88]